MGGHQLLKSPSPSKRCTMNESSDARRQSNKRWDMMQGKLIDQRHQRFHKESKWVGTHPAGYHVMAAECERERRGDKFSNEFTDGSTVSRPPPGRCWFVERGYVRVCVGWKVILRPNGPKGVCVTLKNADVEQTFWDGWWAVNSRLIQGLNVCFENKKPLIPALCSKQEKAKWLPLKWLVGTALE